MSSQDKFPVINPQRVLNDLNTLRGFGAYKTGVHRPSLSPEDVAARKWFLERMLEAGLDAKIDGIGNLLGKSNAPGRKILAGSHLESQNHAGWLDGPLGMVYALEAARALKGFGIDDVGVDVIAFFDEEGHFGSFLGSKSFTGLLTQEIIDSARNRTTGLPLREALQQAGYEGERFHIEPTRYAGFFEAHIEQSDRLEKSGQKIGVVTSIVGNWQYRILTEGEQNHAGTTSMALRRDAGATLIKLLAKINDSFPSIAGPNTVWTTGRIVFEPGDQSIIPGRAEALFQFRDPDIAVLQKLHAALEKVIEKENTGTCKVTLERRSVSSPALMDEHLMQALETSAEHYAPGRHSRMHSRAGHDAQWLAQKIPSVMMFVPSIGGVSHHWSENTKAEDIVLGAQVFASAVFESLKS